MPTGKRNSSKDNRKTASGMTVAQAKARGAAYGKGRKQIKSSANSRAEKALRGGLSKVAGPATQYAKTVGGKPRRKYNTKIEEAGLGKVIGSAARALVKSSSKAAARSSATTTRTAGRRVASTPAWAKEKNPQIYIKTHTKAGKRIASDAKAQKNLDRVMADNAKRIKAKKTISGKAKAGAAGTAAGTAAVTGGVAYAKNRKSEGPKGRAPKGKVWTGTGWK